MNYHVSKLMSAVDLPAECPLYQDIATVMAAHQEMIYQRNDASYFAGHVHKCFVNRGWFEAINYIVTKGDPTGFNALYEARRVHETFESLVLKHASVFPPSVVTIARERVLGP